MAILEVGVRLKNGFGFTQKAEQALFSLFLSFLTSDFDLLRGLFMTLFWPQWAILGLG